jgi:hypothetical protein
MSEFIQIITQEILKASDKELATVEFAQKLIAKYSDILVDINLGSIKVEMETRQVKLPHNIVMKPEQEMRDIIYSIKIEGDINVFKRIIPAEFNNGNTCGIDGGYYKYKAPINFPFTDEKINQIKETVKINLGRLKAELLKHEPAVKKNNVEIGLKINKLIADEIKRRGDDNDMLNKLKF